MAEQLNLRPSERRLLVGVALVLFVVVNIWFVWPHFGDLKDVQHKRGMAFRTLERYNAEISKGPERQAEVNRLGSAGANVARQDQAIELLRAIRKHASDHGVIPERASEPMTRTNEFFIEQWQNVEMVTGESELIDILYDLGSGNSTIRVRDLTVRPDQQRYKLSSRIKLVTSSPVTAPAGKKKPAPAPTAKK